MTSTLNSELARLLDEYADRLLEDDPPSLEEFAGRHPEFASLFRQLATVMEALPSGDGEALPALAGFRICRELGRGGMGVVYEAVEEVLGRRVALKALPTAAAADASLRQRFFREAQAAARLRHTNIVPVYGVGEQNGVHYYIMQAVDGVSLDRLLRVRRPALGEVAVWGRKIADALAHAHGLGVLHRDVKPSNVLIDAAGEPYLTDFGLAKMAGAGDLTGTGEFIGTLRYAAPEQLRDHADERSDVYSLGATLYEQLAGVPVFSASDRTALLRQIVDDEPPPLPATVPHDLAVIVRKALAKDPADRYASAAALAADLRHFEAGEPITAVPVGLWGRLRRWAQRHPTYAGLSAAVALLLFAVAATATVGYLKTSSALADSEKNRKEAERAQHAESIERGRATEGEAKARAALHQTIAAIREAHAIVDAIPAGLMLFIRAQNRSGVVIVRGRDEHTIVMVERLIRVYEEFLTVPIADLEARREQCRAWRRLAFLYGQMARIPEAQNANNQAVLVAEELCRLDNNSRLSRLDHILAKAYRGLYNTYQWVPSDEWTAANRELTAFCDEDPTDPVAPSEQGELIARRGDLLPMQNRINTYSHALTKQKVALARAATPLVIERMTRLYEAILTHNARAKNWPVVHAIFEDWNVTLPPTAEHHFMMASAALYCCSYAVDQEATGPWLEKLKDQLVAYRAKGGIANEATRLLAINKLVKDQPEIMGLLQSLPSKPTTSPK